jgi:thioredoxin-related protein
MSDGSRSRRSALAALALTLVLAPLWAGAAGRVKGMPAAYGAMVIEPVGPPARWEFDLRPAFDRARREGKRLYVYLNADDCAFCRQYEAFLTAHAKELVPEFAKRNYLIVDLQATLKAQADRLFFRVGDQTMSYREYMRALKDERVRQLVYPSVWLFDADGRTLMQMPAGTGTFETVPEQLEILNLVQ